MVLRIGAYPNRHSEKHNVHVPIHLLLNVPHLYIGYMFEFQCLPRLHEHHWFTLFQVMILISLYLVSFVP